MKLPGFSEGRVALFFREDVELLSILRITATPSFVNQYISNWLHAVTSQIIFLSLKYFLTLE
jgi:hypothetical protein